jgi:hypothetical protein
MYTIPCLSHTFLLDVLQVCQQVQRQLAQALFKLSVEFRKEETRFLNKMEAQKGLAAGSSIGLIEEEGGASSAFADPGFTETQLMKVRGLDIRAWLTCQVQLLAANAGVCSGSETDC